MFSINQFTLDNGLRVVHTCDPSSAMVCLTLIYNTGARDEDRSLTGIAHLFEHLMFGGSACAPDFDGTLTGAGGINNAWTSNDFTCFYDYLPAVNAATAFFLESDRMLALNFSPDVLRVQRSVVVEEFKQQCLNQPYGDLWHHIRRHLYAPEHPYSWPVIGLEPAHIESVTDEDTRRWFFSHYAPNNAVLAVAGGLDLDSTRTLAEKWFGRVPRRDIASRFLPDPGFPKSDVVLNVRGRAPQPLVAIAFPMDRYGTPDYFTADTITDILSNGLASRYNRRLVVEGDGLFATADAMIMGAEHEGSLQLIAQLTSDAPADLERARTQLIEQAQALATPGDVSPRELQRAFNRFEANYTFENLTLLGKARTMAEAAIRGEHPDEVIEMHRRVTLDDVARVARKIFSSPSVTINYLPND